MRGSDVSPYMPDGLKGMIEMKLHGSIHPCWFLVMTLLTCSGCATFTATWQATPDPPVDSIEGRWDGHWRSDVNGHNGRLRCILTKLDDGTYRAWFHARFWKVLQFGHKVVLNVEKTASVHRIEGDAHLRWWAGGTYHYEGEVTPTNFTSRYESKHDHGVFEMKRP